MKHLIAIYLAVFIINSYARASSPDTITNFQIYNDAKLVLAGLAPVDGFRDITIKRAELKDLEIQFNYCVGYRDLEITIEVKDENGNNILSKKFKIDTGTRMKIERKELGKLKTHAILIRYVEKRENGMNQILGRILLE